MLFINNVTCNIMTNTQDADKPPKAKHNIHNKIMHLLL